MKKILIVGGLPPPMGGVASLMLRIQNQGLPGGYDHRIVDAKMIGRKIHEKPKFFVEVLRTMRIFKNLFVNLLIYRPALMHLNVSVTPGSVLRNLGCLLLSKMMGVPAVSHFHGNVANALETYRSSRHTARCLKWIIRLSLMNFVQNQPSVDAVLCLQPGYRNRIHILPGFIEDNIFTHYAKKFVSNGNKKRFTAMYAGGIVKSKGCAELLAVAKKLPDIDFILYGEIKKDMEELMSKVPNNVYYGGAVSYDTLLQKMCESDFLLFPTYTEGFPNVVLEAMALGLPVVSTKVGAIPDMIDENEGGLLVNPKQVKPLKEAVALLISRPEQMKVMGEYNRNKCQLKYTYSKVAADMVSLYDQVLGYKSGRQSC